MKRALLIVLTALVLVGTGSVLAVMNNACKTSHHPGALQMPHSGTNRWLATASTHFHRRVICAGGEFECRMSYLFASSPARNVDSGY